MKFKRRERESGVCHFTNFDMKLIFTNTIYSVGLQSSYAEIPTNYLPAVLLFKIINI